MFLLDSLLMAPGKAVLCLFEELAKKAQEEFLDDDTVKQELQEIYGLLEAGTISEQDFAAREYRLVERLQQIARAKLQEIGAGRMDLSVPVEQVTAEPVTDFARIIDVPSQAAIEPAPALERSVEAVALVPSIEPPAPPIPVAPPASTTPSLNVGQVIDCATRGLSMLKLKVSAITSVAREDGGWHVTAELVERKGVPDTSDLLGVYEMRLDDSGNILRYERTRMRRRCDLNR